MRFGPVPQAVNFRELEEELLQRWDDEDLFRRSVSQRAGAEEFVFYEGPPTANGRPGLHHVWARVYKDLFCRFWTMRGRKVERRAGWDTHGLPVEVEVEKSLGLGGKNEIEKFGIAEFVRRCRASVTEYVADWEKLTRRIGFWVDTANAYWTFSSEYVQSVWWHLKQLWEAGLLYEEGKVVPYCSRCGTALSSHELGQEDVYREVEDPAVYVALALSDSGPEGARRLVVWTTTPWTLPSNAAVAVNPDLPYVVVDGYVVAEARLAAVFGEGAASRASRSFRGSELVGLRYERPVQYVQGTFESAWRVVPADFVSADEGTGLVHIAPAFGTEDAQLGRREGLPVINPVGPDGCFTSEAGELAGAWVKDADARIVADLESKGLLLRQERYRHSYPHCWRCGTPLIYWAKPSWFIATSRRKEDLLAANEGVTWRPETVKYGRFGEWLANNVDWALSRDRYWGTPLPIWRCEGGHLRCVGSLGELSELAGRDLSGIDPHRPAIDEVVFACPECASPARRVEPVIDAWFDSGSMPAAQWGYPWKEGSAKAFRMPADFVAEAVDQTRGWFYSLLAVNVLVHGRAPYRCVLCLGHIVDAEGRKMSKSVGNVIDPWDILGTRGADPLRWWMFHQGSPWTATRTSLEAIDSSTAETLVTLWNVWSFFSTYASLNDFDPTDPAIPAPRDRYELDRWMVSRLNSTIAEVTVALEDYQPLNAAVALGQLVDDLSNWYVRRSRRRFWKTDPDIDPVEVLGAHATLYEALRCLAAMLAPFCPFFADAIWRSLRQDGDYESVHLADWPIYQEQLVDKVLEAEMAQARRLVSLGRAARSQAGVKVRQPLRKALVVLPPGHPRLLEEVVADELNVDKVVEVDALGSVLSFEVVPNFRLLGPRLGALVGEVKPALAALDPREILERLEAGEPLSIGLSSGQVQLGPNEVEVRVKAKEGFAVSREGTEAVALDLALDEELLKRGQVRDLVRQVQELRRSAGLAVEDRIRLHLEGVDDLADFAEEIAREVLAVEVNFGPVPSGQGAPLRLGSSRVAKASLEKA